MCFPFNLNDEQLEECFSAGYNICEFTAAKIVKLKDDPETKAMVLYFTDVAKSEYIDDVEHVYSSAGTTKIQEVEYRWYKDENNVEYKPDNNNSGKWRKIQGVLAFAGHPYMIHPNVGVVEGDVVNGKPQKRVKSFLSGLKYFSGSGYDPCENPSASGGYRTLHGTKEITVYTQKQLPLVDWTEGENNPGTELGKMTFMGKVVETTKDPKKVPQNSYFLANVTDTRLDGTSMETGVKRYPKYYRQTEANPTYGNWTQYTAVVIPDNDASSWLSSNVWNLHTSASGSSSASSKSANVVFDSAEEFEDVSTQIENVLQDAQERKLPVEYYKVIYNINGQVVKTGTTDTRNLPTGVYIINGKKYFVK